MRINIACYLACELQIVGFAENLPTKTHYVENCTFPTVQPKWI